MKGRGEIAACADDIGGVLKSFHFLEYLFPIFEDCEKLANLVLKPQVHVSPDSQIGQLASQNLYVRVDHLNDTQMAKV
eukprot:5710784-Karenia_brevis.AAC.1